MSKLYKFHVGDRAKFGGLMGTVTETGGDYLGFTFDDPKLYPQSFFLDGRYNVDHIEPTLILIEKAKRKVKKEVKAWVSIYPNEISIVHASPDNARVMATAERITIVECTGTYEVEE